MVGLHHVVRHALFHQFPPPLPRQESKYASPQCSAVFQMKMAVEPQEPLFMSFAK